jgi:peptidoglycan/xylan/chitin deacetylase (PgdA/CDA1 family)
MLRRLRRLKRLARRLIERDRPVILSYHRVATVACDPWALAVRPDRFAEQIEALVQERRVVPLSWLAGELSQGRAPKKSAAVTFDDGYADVLTEGCPILERFDCPATVFLTTGAIGRGEPFWWDELAHIVLSAEVLPLALTIEIGGRSHSWRLAEGPAEGAPDPGVVDRRALHLALWTLLRPLDGAERDRHLARLAEWSGTGRLSPDRSRAMDAEEVRRLARPGLIDIGAHTVTHPSMPLLDRGGQEAEIEQSRRACEALAGVPIDGFAYPFGDHDAASVAMVRNARFVYACTTEPGTVGTRSDLLRLPRATIGDWSGTELMRVLGGSPARA